MTGPRTQSWTRVWGNSFQLNLFDLIDLTFFNLLGMTFPVSHTLGEGFLRLFDLLLRVFVGAEKQELARGQPI